MKGTYIMKTMKKITSLVLALALVLTMSAGVFAADKLALSLDATNLSDKYEFEVYQIFKGDVVLEGTDEILSNIAWGDGLKADYTNGKDAKTVAEGLVGNVEAVKAISAVWAKNLSGNVSATLNDANGFSDKVDPGYYLIINTKVPADSAYSKYIVQMTASTNVEPKAEKPKFDKHIMDVNDSETVLTDADDMQNPGDVQGNTANSKWEKTADYDIGDKVPFKLSARVASDFQDYKSAYKLVFEDQLSPELDLIEDSFVVKVDNTLITSGYTVSAPETLSDGSTKVLVTFDDLKTISEVKPGSTINVFLKATLNEKAKVGATTDSLNKGRLHYSNNPNDEQGGEPEGETPWETVWVFTFELDVNKVKANPDFDDSKPESETNKKTLPLKGAEFTLYKKNANGDYEVEFDKDGTGRVKKVVVTDETIFAFRGLDAGDYKLVESKVPAGYNKIADVEFTVLAEHSLNGKGKPQLTKLETVGLATNLVDGALVADVLNSKGLTLPETGGMGTTILYVLGAMLAVGAAVLLVTKKIVGQK